MTGGLPVVEVSVCPKVEIQSVSSAPQLGLSEAGLPAAPAARAEAVTSGGVVPCHVPVGILMRICTDLKEWADVTVNVPDSLPEAILYANPFAPLPVPEPRASSRNSVSDAPQEPNSALAVPPWYWMQRAMMRSPAEGANVVRLGKVCVVDAGEVVDERSVFAPVVGMVGNAIQLTGPDRIRSWSCSRRWFRGLPPMPSQITTSCAFRALLRSDTSLGQTQCCRLQSRPMTHPRWKGYRISSRYTHRVGRWNPLQSSPYPSIP